MPKKSLFLDLGTPPIFIETLKDSSITPGNPVVISCSFSGTSPITVTWYQGANVVENSHFRSTTDNCSWAKLEIPSAQYEHSGVYRVRIENLAGFADSSANLQIIGQAPNFTSIPSVINGIVKNQLQLETTVVSQPRCTCYWEFEGNEITGQRYKIYSEDEKQVLVIDELLASDAGRYTCVAENELGTAQWSANVRVDVADRSDSQLKKRTASPKADMKQREGSPKSKKMRSRESSPTKKGKKKTRRGKSDLELETKKEKKSSSDEEVRPESTATTLSSQHPPQTPASEYEADWMLEEKAKQDKTKRKVKAFVPQPKPEPKPEVNAKRLSSVDLTSDKPVFVEVPVSAEHVVSETATFQCTLAGNPMPEIQWYKGKWGKLSSFGRIKVDYDKKTGITTLKISKLDKPDKGMYRIVAKNKHGEANQQFDLTIVDKQKPSTERIALKKVSKVETEEDKTAPMELLKYVDPKEFEKYANHFGVTDFRNLLAPVEYSVTESEVESSFSPSESDISDFNLVDVLAEMRDTTGRIGHDVKFSTELQINVPGVDVQWYRKKDKITNNDKFKIKQKGNIHELTIQNLQPEDLGEYRVIAGPYQHTAKLEIIDEGKSLPFAPSSINQHLDPKAREFFITPLLDLHSVCQGEDVELTCTVSDPDCEVEWLANDEVIITPLETIVEEDSDEIESVKRGGKPPIHPDTYNKKYVASKKGKTRKLRIRDADPALQSGLNYTCRPIKHQDAKTSAKVLFHFDGG